MNELDCVVVGTNELNVDLHYRRLEKMKKISGAYFPMITALAKHEGRWMGAMELLNHVLKSSTAKDFDFHILDLPNLAVCFLTSYLREKGFSVESINFFNKGRERLKKLLRRGCRSVAISSSMYSEIYPVAELVQFIRKHNQQVEIIVGGPYINNLCSFWDETTQEHLLSKMGADFYIAEAQGEDSLARLLSELRKGGKANIASVPNLIYKRDEQASPQQSFARTKRARENNDINQQMIDWKQFPRSLYSPTALMRTSKGCPFSCSFCTYPVLGGPYRPIDISLMEKEMRQFAEVGVKTILFVDDTFNASKERFKNILKMMIKNEFSFSWYSMLRISNIDEEAFELMRDSGCAQLQLGIESGSQRILDLMDKRAEVGQYRWGIEKAKEFGIRTIASCIAGFPGETAETFQETEDFIKDTRPDYYFTNLYFHSKEAPIAKRGEEFQVKGRGYSWSHETMDWRQAIALSSRMYREIEHSMLPPHYMFYSSYAPPYLESKGISRSLVDQYVRLWRSVILSNLEGREHDFSAIYKLGEKIAKELWSERE